MTLTEGPGARKQNAPASNLFARSVLDSGSNAFTRKKGVDKLRRRSPGATAWLCQRRTHWRTG
ncbi:unnamed protein product [Penicillium pancosmium]